MDGSASFTEKFNWFFSEHRKTLFLRGVNLEPRQRAYILLKSDTRDLRINPSV